MEPSVCVRGAKVLKRCARGDLRSTDWLATVSVAVWNEANDRRLGLVRVDVYRRRADIFGYIIKRPQSVALGRDERYTFGDFIHKNGDRRLSATDYTDAFKDALAETALLAWLLEGCGQSRA